MCFDGKIESNGHKVAARLCDEFSALHGAIYVSVCDGGFPASNDSNELVNDCCLPVLGMVLRSLVLAFAEWANGQSSNSTALNRLLVGADGPGARTCHLRRPDYARTTTAPRLNERCTTGRYAAGTRHEHHAWIASLPSK